jgi:hypothetical protein
LGASGGLGDVDLRPAMALAVPVGPARDRHTMMAAVVIATGLIVLIIVPPLTFISSCRSLLFKIVK